MDVAAATELGFKGVCGPLNMLAELVIGKHILLFQHSLTDRAVLEQKYAALIKAAATCILAQVPDGGVYQSMFRGDLTPDDLIRIIDMAVPITLPGGGRAARKTSAEHAAQDGDAIYTFLSDVAPESVDWLYHDRVAIGKLTLVAGDGGLGKSFVTLDWAARISMGTPWPDRPDDPIPAGGVVLINAEDDIADTVRPRLDAAKANSKRILMLKAVKSTSSTGEASERMFDLEYNIAALRQAIVAVEVRGGCPCRLVIIDPVTAYLGKNEGNDNGDIRGLLGPLAMLASEMKVAIVLVSHLTKGRGPAMNRVLGSVAFVAAVRSAWVFVADKTDKVRRLILPLKNNLGPDTAGMAYRIVPLTGFAQPLIEWEPKPIYISADEALGEQSGAPADRRTEVDDAAEWLNEYLATGPKFVNEVEKDAKAAGFSPATLKRAKSSVSVKSVKIGFEKGWSWKLPSRTEDAHAAEEVIEAARARNG